MSEIIGRQIELGVGVEAVRGTALNGASKWIKNVSADIIAQAEKVKDDNTRGILEDSENYRVTQKWFEGELSGVLHADVLGYFLTNLYGDVQSAPAGSMFDHDFTLEQSIQHASLTLFAIDGSVQSKKFANAVVGSLEVSASIDDFVRFTANLIASTEATHTQEASYDTELDWIGKDITIKVANDVAGLGAAQAQKIKNVAITWDPNIIRDHVFGSYNPDDLYNSRMMIQIALTKNFTDTTFKDLFTADTKKAMSISIVGTNGAEFTITMPAVQVTAWERAGANDDLVTEDIELEAMYDETEENQSEVLLTNNVDAYSAGS